MIWDPTEAIKHRTFRKTDGQWSTLADDIKRLNQKKGGLILARYWCDLVRCDGNWSQTFLLSAGTNSTFDKECQRLSLAGVPGNLVDMVGDGNCLFYCMLHYLHARANRLVHNMGKDYPLIWMRKLLRDFGSKLDVSYWTYGSSDAAGIKLPHIYDPMVNFMDEEFTRNVANQDCQGDQFDVFIFAAAFKLEAVVYSLALGSPMTYYADGRQFDDSTGTGLITAGVEGICSDLVPYGNQVFTVVNYNCDVIPTTDDESADDDASYVEGTGPPHWIRVTCNVKSPYTARANIPNLIDYHDAEKNGLFGEMERYHPHLSMATSDTEEDTAIISPIDQEETKQEDTD
jgi:hypothetical protein